MTAGALRPGDAVGGHDVGGGPVLSHRDFERMGRFIEARLGIRMPAAKRLMLESRLKRRLRALGMSAFGDYVDFVLAAPETEEELVHLTSAVTTNKTDFFREPQHFEILVKDVLPELGERVGLGPRRALRVWSAGCSSGQEPYTLAMVLAEVSERTRMPVDILASDISMRVLERALRAVYGPDDIGPIAPELRKKHLLRRRGQPQVFRIAPELRALVRFRIINLLEAPYPVDRAQDVIFCRNVFIYFDRATQEQVLRRFCDVLVPGGFLFLGHSETITGLDVPLEPVAPTVYRHTRGR